jgi:creatinine amidohydrolase
MNDAIEMQKVVILPAGSTEQHGLHLPLDTDVFLVESVCLEVGRRVPDQVLVLPPISYGLNLHHIDFPGTIHIEPETFIAFGLNITKSLAYHGFEKILLVNGHGSNSPLVDLIARKTVLATHSICTAVSYFALLGETFEKVRETAVIAHADELETSLYLYLAPDRVRVDDMVEGNDVMGEYFSSDSTANYPVRFNDFWGRWTQKGVHGDPRAATPEKGKLLFEAAVGELARVVAELRAWPIADRSDQHRGPVQSDITW